MIPTEDYTKILANVPVPTVDILVIRNGKYLLVKRAKKPLKGQWWPPGGRVLRGESLEQAVKRKLSEEVGIHDCASIRFVGVYEDKYEDNEFGLGFIHTISSVFLAMPWSPLWPGKPKIKLDDQSTTYRWSRVLPERLHGYLTEPDLFKLYVGRVGK